MANISKTFPADWLTIESDASQDKMRVKLGFPTVGQYRLMTRAMLSGDGVIDTVRYVVKDWENVSVDDKLTKCELTTTNTGSELTEDSLWVLLALGYQFEIFALFHKYLTLPDTEKKTSSSSLPASSEGQSAR